MAPKTIDDLFREFGGTAAVGRILGKQPSTASEMKRRGRIPVDHWPALIESEKGKTLGITADDLMRLHMSVAA